MRGKLSLNSWAASLRGHSLPAKGGPVYRHLHSFAFPFTHLHLDGSKSPCNMLASLRTWCQGELRIEISGEPALPQPTAFFIHLCDFVPTSPLFLFVS